jgi:hypothetical protein
MLRKFQLRIESDPTPTSDHHLRVTTDGQTFLSEPSKQPSLEFACEFSIDQNSEIKVEIIRDRQLFFTTTPVGKFNVRDLYATPRKYLSYELDNCIMYKQRFGYVAVIVSQLKLEKVESGATCSKKVTALSMSIDDKFKPEIYCAVVEDRLAARGRNAKSLSDAFEAKMGRILSHLLDKITRNHGEGSKVNDPLCQMIKLTFNPQQQHAEYSLCDFYPGSIVTTIPQFDSMDLNARYLNANECCQLRNGDYILAGGCSMDNVVKYKHLMILCPKLRRTFVIGTLPHYRKGHTVKYIDGKLFIIGGRINQETVFSKTVWSYNVQQRAWQEKSNLTNAYEISQRDFMEVFGSKKYLFVMMKKSFAMEYLSLTDGSSSWKRIEEPKSIKTFSNLALVKQDEQCAYLMLQDFMNEHTFHLVSFAYDTFEFKSLKTACDLKDINLKYFFRNSDFIYFLLENSQAYSRMNVSKAIASAELKDAVETFVSPNFSTTVSELIVAKRDFATLFLESRYHMSPKFKDEYYCISESGVSTLSAGNSTGSIVPINFAYQPFKKPGKKSVRVETESLHSASVVALLDGTLFVNSWQKTNDCWIGKNFLYSSEGFVRAQANSICRLNAELIQHQEYIYMIGGTHKNTEAGIDVVEVYDLMLGKWVESIEIPRRLTLTRSFVKDNKLNILYDFLANIKVITIDLETNRLVSERGLNFTFENINIAKSISVNLLSDRYVLIAYNNQDSASSFMLYDTFEETKAEYSIALQFNFSGMTVIDDYVILIVEEDGVRKIKKMEKVFLAEFLITNQPIDFQTTELKIDSAREQSSFRIFPVLNNVDSFLPFNYFKYNRNQNARDQPTQYWSINSKGVFCWDDSLNSLQRLSPLGKTTSLPSKAVAFPFDNKLLISGGLIKEANRLVSTNAVSAISMANPQIEIHSYMNMTRFGHVMLSNNGRLHSIGGYKDPSRTHALNQVEFFNSDRGEWLYLEGMNYKRAEFSAVSVLGRIVVFFGCSDGKVLNSVETYNPEEDKWQILKNFPSKFCLKNHHVQLINFRSVVIFGGLDENDKPNFDFITVTFEDLFNTTHCVTKLEGKLPTALINPVSNYEGKELTIFGDKIYKFKNIYKHKLNFQFSESQELNYQTYLDDCDETVSLGVSYIAPLKNDYHVSTLSHEFRNEFKYLYIFGIENVPQIYRINLVTFVWEILPNPPNFVFQDYACAVSLPDGSFLVAGGLDGKSSHISKNAFNLKFNEGTRALDCTKLVDMNNARYTFTGIYLDDYVYMIGGRQLGSVD